MRQVYYSDIEIARCFTFEYYSARRQSETFNSVDEKKAKKQVIGPNLTDCIVT